MNSQKFLVGGIVGGIIYFLLGWLIYGLLLKDFFASNSTPGLMKADADLVWWALIVGNLAFGFLLTFIIGRGGSMSAGSGAGTGFVVGVLMNLGFDMISYATSTVTSSLKLLAADIAVAAVMSAIAGAVIGGVLGMNRKAVA